MKTLRLDPELTIYGAAQLRATLLEALEDGTALTLELDDVCEFDSAGMQVLLAAARSATLHLQGHSPVVLEALALFGLDLQLQPARQP